MPRPLASALFLLPLLAGGCFEGPERLDSRSVGAGAPMAAPRTPARDQGLPEGHPPIPGQGLPEGHPPIPGQGLPQGHPPLPGQMPAGHPPLGGSPHGAPHGGHAAVGGAPVGPGEALLGGRVVLRGALAERREGGVFLIGRASGAGMLLVRKLELSEARPGAEGVLELAFQLDGQDVTASSLPDRMQLEVYFDPDGVVETREGRVGRTFEVERGDLALELVLDPDRAASGSY